jgi:hypothetical protein
MQQQRRRPRAHSKYSPFLRAVSSIMNSLSRTLASGRSLVVFGREERGGEKKGRGGAVVVVLWSLMQENTTPPVVLDAHLALLLRLLRLLVLLVHPRRAHIGINTNSSPLPLVQCSNCYVSNVLLSATSRTSFYLLRLQRRFQVPPLHFRSQHLMARNRVLRPRGP